MVGTLQDIFNPLQSGERIVYTFGRSQEGKSKAIARKHGVFLTKVRHPKKYWAFGHRKQKAVVKFDGNKNESRVDYTQLKRETRG